MTNKLLIFGLLSKDKNLQLLANEGNWDAFKKRRLALYKKDFRKRNYDRIKKQADHYFDFKEFGGNRIKTLERDQYKCVVCGLTQQQHIERFGKNLTVDHIDRRGRYAKIKNNALENLQTLCLPCHGYKDSLNKDKTHCKQGHEFSVENTIIRKIGWRNCKECQKRTYR